VQVNTDGTLTISSPCPDVQESGEFRRIQRRRENVRIGAKRAYRVDSTRGPRPGAIGLAASATFDPQIAQSSAPEQASRSRKPPESPPFGYEIFLEN